MTGYAGDIGRGLCWRCHQAFARRLARSFVPILGGLVANEAEHAAGDIGNDKLVGQGAGEFVPRAGDVVEEGVDVLPFRPGNDLEEAVCGSDGAVFGAGDLSSF